MNVIILGKAAICIFGFALSFIAVELRLFSRLTNRQFSWIALLLLILARIGIFVGVFLVLGMRDDSYVIRGHYSDVSQYYYEAHQVYDHKLPGYGMPWDSEKFFNPYGPLFPFVAAGPTLLWDSSRSIILFGLLLEFASLPLWLTVARLAMPEQVARRAALLYILCPLTLGVIPLAGQNDVWLAFFLALALWMLSRKRDLLSGIALGAGIVCVKWLSIIHFPALWLFSAKRSRFTSGLLLLPVLVYGLWIWLGYNPLVNFKFHAEDRSSGNLPFLLTIVGMDFNDELVRRLTDLSTMGALAGISLAAALRFRRLSLQALPAMLALLTLALLLFSKKAFTSYLLMAIFPLCLIVAARTRTFHDTLLFLLFTSLAMMEPTLQARWLAPLHPPDFRILWSFGQLSSESVLQVLAFLLVELLLLAGYVYYGWQMWRHMCEAHIGKSPQAAPA